MRTLANSFRLLAVAAMVVLTVPATYAEDFLGLQFHGFGGWYYGRSNSVQFMDAQKGGTAQTTQFALNAAARPADNLRVMSQINFREQQTGSKVQLDYAFVEFDVASRLKLRAGRAKHPWGIYGEIFDVGTARPFQHLSQALYGPVGFTAKAYNGVGLTGSAGGAGGWGLQYDLYGGEMDAEYEETGLFSLTDPVAPTLTQKYVLKSLNKDFIGTRVQLNTPVEGMWVGGSAYTGMVNLTGFAQRRADAYLGSFEYNNDRFLLRSEAGHIEADKEVKQNGAFVETALKVTEHWQVAARWDSLTRDITGLASWNIAQIPPQMMPLLAYRLRQHHSERVAGINYWVSPNVVVRASLSQVKGPTLLYPTVTQLATYLQTGFRPKDQANVILVGTQFSF